EPLHVLSHHQPRPRQAGTLGADPTEGYTGCKAQYRPCSDPPTNGLSSQTERNRGNVDRCHSGTALQRAKPTPRFEPGTPFNRGVGCRPQKDPTWDLCDRHWEAPLLD